MSLEDLRKRYLWIAKNSLSFLKEKGFQKKGMKYFKKTDDLIFVIGSCVPRGWLNSEDSYEFEIFWDITSINPELIQLYKFIEEDKKAKEVNFCYRTIIPDHLQGKAKTLGDEDPAGFDQKYVEGIKEKLEIIVLPLFDCTHSLDDLIHLAEQEANLEREKRQCFLYGVYHKLAMLYVYKGWKDKALEMCDKSIEVAPVATRHFSEDNKKKYIQYFEQIRKI
jgi:hypothetical protein